MKVIYFKALKYTIIGWTLTITIALIFAVIFCKDLADEWTEFYLSHDKNLTSIKPMMKVVNNSYNNKSFYEYDSNGHGFDKVILKNAHKKGTIILILMTAITGAIFHSIGLIGSVKSIHCLVLMFAIYMTFSSVILLINSFTFYWEFIPFLIYSVITILTYCLCVGIREERFRVLSVGVIDPPNLSQTSINTMHYNKPENCYKLYPDLSQQIFYVESQPFHDCVPHVPAVPSAPPLPSTQYVDFSNF